jgi:hypothetical protein
MPKVTEDETNRTKPNNKDNVAKDLRADGFVKSPYTRRASFEE